MPASEYCDRPSTICLAGQQKHFPQQLSTSVHQWYSTIYLTSFVSSYQGYIKSHLHVLKNTFRYEKIEPLVSIWDFKRAGTHMWDFWLLTLSGYCNHSDSNRIPLQVHLRQILPTEQCYQSLAQGWTRIAYPFSKVIIKSYIWQRSFIG